MANKSSSRTSRKYLKNSESATDIDYFLKEFDNKI